MFETEHVLYILISFSLTALIILFAKRIKSRHWKNVLLVTIALVTRIIHISRIYVTFFTDPVIVNGVRYGRAWDDMFLPIYFCNYCMFLLILAAVWTDKKSRFFNNLATFTAYGCIVGGTMTILGAPPGVSEWSTFQLALSHSTMLLGGWWLIAGGYVNVNVYNAIPMTFGFISCGIVGGLCELVYHVFGLPSPNAMFMVTGVPGVEWCKWWVIVIGTYLVVFAYASLYERFTREKQRRWYRNISDIWLYLKPLSEFKRRQKGARIKGVKRASSRSEKGGQSYAEEYDEEDVSAQDV